MRWRKQRMNQIEFEQEQPLQHDAPALTTHFLIRRAFRARKDEAPSMYSTSSAALKSRMRRRIFSLNGFELGRPAISAISASISPQLIAC